MQTVGAATAQAQAALVSAAKQHKRLEREHRREARRLMQAAAEFGAACQALGLEFEFIDTAKEAESDG